MNIREIRQREFADIVIKKNKGLLHLCSRFGKVRTCFQFIQPDDKVLVIYPKKSIKETWVSEGLKWGVSTDNFVFTTTHSVRHHVFTKFDWVIWDEPQEYLSDRFLKAMKSIVTNNDKVIGLSGSLSFYTQKKIFNATGLSVIANYPTSLAIEEGVICDYEIRVKYVKLESEMLPKYKRLSAKINSLSNLGRDTKFLSLQRMSLLHNSTNKLRLAKEAVEVFEKHRYILFSHKIKFIDQLGIPVYHSKKKDEQVLKDFQSGKISHLATLDMLSAGIGFPNLNTAIIATFTSNPEELYQRINRITALEMNNPSKKAIVYILCLKDTQEEKWLFKALSLFEKEKIKIIT